MLRKIGLAFVLVMALAACECFAVEDGSSWENAYVIDSYSEFRTFMQNEAYTTTGKYFKLSCDIQMSGYSNWEPAGTFNGHFDGQGHIIYVNIQPLPLTVGNYINQTYDRSLFGVVSSNGDDAIVNLNVEGTVRGYNAGGLMSILKAGTIRNCAFSGDIIVETSPEGDDAMDELIIELGDADIQDANGVEILDDVTTKTKVYGKINAGGIAAVMLGGNIEDSTFRGNVIASADKTPACAGGIVGRMIEDSENITGCYTEGDAVIVASTTESGYGVLASAGGIVGYANTQLDCMIESCSFDAVVNSTYYAGGIAGLVRGTILSGDTVTSTARITGAYSAGGIAGYMASGAWAIGNTVEPGAVITAEEYSAGGIVGLLETNGRTGGSKPIENNSSGATLSGEVYTGSIIGALGNNTYSGTVYGEGNTYTGTEDYYLIGRDEWGQPSNADTYSITTNAITWTVGTTKTVTLTLSPTPDSGTTVTWTISGLPDGLTSDSSGNITGAPTIAGTYIITAAAKVADDDIGPMQITLTVADNESGFRIVTSSLSQGTQDSSYSALITPAGYSDYDYDSIVWEVSGNNLPSGLSFGNASDIDSSYDTTDVRGLLAGTPTVWGTYTFTLKATLLVGSASYSAAKSFTLDIAPSKVTVSTDELPDAILRRYYSADIEADISSKWTLTDGALPNGLSLSTTTDGKGRISGTPSESGSFTFTLTAAASELTGSKTFTLVVNNADFTITTGSLLKPGIVGTTYTDTLSHDAGASASAVWYVYSGTLPAGLSLSRSAGTITGTPTTAGTYTFRIGLMIGDQITSKSFTIVIIPSGTTSTISITTDLIKPGIKDSVFSQDLTTNADSDGLRIWYIDSGKLPEGLTLSSSTGRISGTPTTAGSYTFTIGLYANEQITTKTFEMTIVPSDSTYGYSITTESLTPGTRGQVYTQSLSTNAPAENRVWYIDSGSLPAGLTLSRSTGVISGTPAESGTYTFTVGLWAGNLIITKTFALVIVPGIMITTDWLKPGIRGQEYDTVTLSNDSGISAASCTWYLESGNLPNGLSLSSAGIISGTPTTAGTYTFTIGLLAGSYTATKSFTIVIIPATMPSDFSITTDALRPAIRGTAYSFDIVTDASSSLGTQMWYIDSGTLPSGLSLSTTGTISGTPTTAGTYSFTIGLLVGSEILTKDFTLVVIPATTTSDFSIITDALKPAIRGTTYNFTLVTDASASLGTQTWYIDSGTLPAGLSLSSAGTISGTPTTAGSYTFTVGLFIDTQIVTQSFTLTVIPATLPSDFSITTDTITPAIIGETYSFTLDTDALASLGTPVWYVDSGTLPDGLTLSASGDISGTPTTSGSYSFTIGLFVGDKIVTKTFTMVVIHAGMPSNFSITTNAITPGTRGTTYSLTLAANASSSLGSRTWYVYSGSLPGGLSLSSAGVISGTPTSAGTYSFTIGLFVGGQIATKTFSMVIADSSSGFLITTDAIKPAVRGTAYSYTLNTDADSSLGTPIWYIDSGNLPTGLTLSSTGTISGTPTTAGSYTFTAGVFIDTQIVTKTFTMVVISAAMPSDFSITTDALTYATRGTAYSFTLATDADSSLGTPVWFIDSGTLPDGLTLSSTGIISGTPTSAGTYSFTIGIIVGNQIATKTLSMVVIYAAVSSDFSITTGSLSTGIRGVPYSQTLTDNASSSLTPRVWYLAEGELPTGLTLSRYTGTISGTPTSSGTYTFAVGLIAGGITATKTFTLIIFSGLSITTDWLKPAIQGTHYSVTLSADSVVSKDSCVWYIESGSLPKGLTLSRTTGILSGTPTESGTYSFTVGLLADGMTASRAFTLYVISGVVSSDYAITTESLSPGIAGTAYSQTLTSNVPDSVTPRLWYIDSGTFPEGLSLSRSTGVISGTPSSLGTYTFVVGLLAGNNILTKTFTLTVIPGTSITTEALAPGTEGKSYRQTLTSDASAGSRVWYIDTGELPPGLTLARNTGVISGVPTKSGSYTFRVRLLAGNQITAKTFTLLIIPGLAIDSNILPEGKEGENYSYTFTASADTAVWTHTAGTLPPGLSLSTTGILSGTPTKAGTYSFTVRAVSSAEGLSSEQTFSLMIRPVFSILNGETLPRAKVNNWYSVTLSADAEASYFVNWRLIDGALPSGMYLNSSTGNISGTPQAEGTYTFTIQAAAGSYIAATRFTLIVGPALEILTEAKLPSWKLNKYYSMLFTTDSALPVNWTLSDGSIPSGLTFAYGVLDGTPTTEGTYSFTLTAESGGMTSSKTFTMTIIPALSITTPEVLPSVKAGAYYSYTLSSDADDPSTVLWSTTYYSTYYGLPSGMYIDEETGTIYGTPTVEGTYTFMIRAVMGSISTSKEFTLTVRPMLSITTENILPHAEVNEKYSVTLLTDADEDQAVTWSVIDGNLPDRLTLDSQTGELSGYPLNEGTYTFTIQAFSNGLTAQKRFELTAGEIMSIITSQSNLVLEAGEYFELALLTDKTNGESAAWSVIDGILPPGIDLNTSTGLISGTPSRAGRYTFTVKAESGYSVAQKELTLIVDFTIESEQILPSGAVGESYSYRFTAKGVSASAVLWTVSSDAVLPTGLTLAANGILSGTTNHAGTYTFMLYAFVSNDVSTMQTVRLTIEADPNSAVPILTVSLPDGKIGEEYYAELSAGIEGVTWGIDSGEIPEGLTLRADGLISGVPTKAGVYVFIVKVYASNRDSTRQFTITINAAPEVEHVSGGGGGGCDSGIGVMGLVVLGLMFWRRRQ